MSKVGIICFVFSSLFFGSLLSSCDLFEDDEHCDYTRGDIEIWNNGNFVEYGYFRSISDADEPGVLTSIYLGGREFIKYTDVCTSKDVTISAEVEIKEKAWELHNQFWACYLIVSNGFKAVKGSNYWRMARINLEENKLKINPIKIPVSPSFENNFIEGELIVKLSLYFGHDGLKHEEDEVAQIAQDLANAIVQKATVTVEYTVY